MNLPDEQQWLRVEKLADELKLLAPEELASYLSRLAAAGESRTVLTLLGSWLSLPPPAVPIQSGTTVAGRYILKEKIGEGGMGSVWRAKQNIVDRDVALKMIHSALVVPELKARFLSEIELLGRLHHPGIVQIFDAGMHEQVGLPAIPFFTMELVEGVPLNHWAAAHQENQIALLRVMAAVCEAVQNAHERRIVHRDLKPGNILVRADGRPVVLDFGIARLAGAVSGDESGMFSGTPLYAAPEQHWGRDQDFHSGESVDIYATGVILFEILSGRRVFEFPRGVSLTEMRRRVVEGALPRLSEALPDCLPLLDEIVGRALRRDPADRFYSMAALGRALGRAAASLDHVTPPPSPWRPSVEAVVPGTGWRLTRKIGEGSAGEVWLGIHEQLRERRVFKFCDTEEKARTLKRELTLFRLLKERVGRNPHFVPLHEVSLDEPPWYLMMDYVDVHDLVAWCAEQPGGIAALPEETRVEIVAQIAEGLQGAHEAGILHRDIKPSNVLVQGHGRDGDVHVFITDFGIGQIVATELLLGGTRMGFTRTVSELRRSTLSGTMLYMAPEVLEGNPSTARSDIYSAGVVLWQLLIGNLHAALDPAEWPTRIRDPLLRADLHRCLCGEPEKRWASAGELAASLRQLPERRLEERRRQEEISARERAGYRRGVLRTASIALAVAMALGWLAWFGWERSAEAERQRRIASLGRTRTGLAELQAIAQLKSGATRSKLAEELPKLEPKAAGLEREFREVALRILVCPGFEPLEPRGDLPAMNDAFASNGERLIRFDRSSGLAVIELSTEPHLVVPLAGATSGFSGFNVNASGRTAGAVDPTGTLHLWYGSDLSKTRTLPGPVHANAFALSPTTLSRSKNTAVALARADGAVEVFPVERDEGPVRLLRKSSPTVDAFPESCPPTMMAFCPVQEGILAVAGPDSGNVLFWKLIEGQKGNWEGRLATAAWHPDRITCLGWSTAREEIATGSRDGILRVWRFVITGSSPQTEPSRRADLGAPIRDVVWNGDGGLIAVLLDSGKIHILQSDFPEQSAVMILEHADAARIAFTPGNSLVSWGPTGARSWGAKEVFFSERKVAPSAAQVTFHENGSLTVAGSDRIDFLNPSTLAGTGGFKADSLYAPSWHGSTLFFDALGSWKSAVLARGEAATPSWKLPRAPKATERTQVIIASAHGKRTAWLHEGQLRCFDKDHREEGTASAISDHVLLAVSDAAPVTAWTTEGGMLRVRHHLSATAQQFQSSNAIIGLSFATESDLMACRTDAGVTFLNPVTGQTVSCALPAPGTLSSPVAFSADAHWLAVIGVEHTLLVAELPPGPERWENNGAALSQVFLNAVPLVNPKPRRIRSLAWNPWASRLACGTADGFVQSWNVSLLRRQLRLWNLDWAASAPPSEPDFVPIRLN